MFTIEYQAVINAPLETVFKFVADSRNDPKWCPTVLTVQQLKDNGPRKGAKYALTAKPGPVKTEGVFELVEFEPNKKAGYRGTNSAGDFHYEYIFDSLDKGTRIHMRSRFQPKGMLRLLQPIIHRSSRKVTVLEFENLKKIL
jgi:uncharacterized protein YndB with AHSA1/START domain